MTAHRTLYPLVTFLLISTLVFAESSSTLKGPLKKVNGILVDAEGMTVYTFDKDVPGSSRSACHGSCSELWPPVPVGDPFLVKAPYSIVIRYDRTTQLAYKGKPIYYYIGDRSPGSRNGDNFRNLWHVIKEKD